MIVRIYWQVRGEHVHCRLFVADQPLAKFALAGELVLSKDEFVALSTGKFQAEFFEQVFFEAGEPGNGG